MKRIITLAALLIGASLNAGQNTAVNPDMVQQGLDYLMANGGKVLGDWFSNKTTTPTVSTPDHTQTTGRISNESHGLLFNQEGKLEGLITERDVLKRQLINKQEDINKLRATISAEKHRAGIHHNAGHQQETMTDALKDKFGNWLTEQMAQYK